MNLFKKVDTTIIEVKHGKYLYPCRIKIPESIPVKGVHVIYGLKDPRNEQIYYIGRTKELLVRIRAHCRVYPYNIKRNLDQRKLDIFSANLLTECVLLHVCQSEDEAIEAEYAFIKKHEGKLLNTQTNKFHQEPLEPTFKIAKNQLPPPARGNLYQIGLFVEDKDWYVIKRTFNDPVWLGRFLAAAAGLSCGELDELLGI